jgi:hypothetical protein
MWLGRSAPVAVCGLRQARMKNWRLTLFWPLSQFYNWWF